MFDPHCKRCGCCRYYNQEPPVHPQGRGWMRHHTKDKGDLAVGKVIADLLAKGFQVCLPMSEHLPFDLVAVSHSSMELSRVQVRYAASKRGCLKVSVRSSHSDRRGVHHRRVPLGEIDAFAVYCPQADKVYYVRRDEIPENLKSDFALRVAPARNGQVRKIRSAEDFVGPSRMFGPVAQVDRAAVF